MDIIIFDRQEITREGLRSILSRCPEAGEIRIAGQEGGKSLERPEGPESLKGPEDRERPLVGELMRYPESIVFLDYTLTDMTIEQLLVLNQRFAAAHFVLFCESLSRESARRMLLTSRRFHILLKDSSAGEVCRSLTEICRGEQFYNTRLQAWLDTREETARTPLTATEKEILKAMSLGKTTKEIAAERFSSVHTVMTHRKNIFRKLDVNNAQEAVRYAVRAGIVDVMEYYI